MQRLLNQVPINNIISVRLDVGPLLPRCLTGIDEITYCVCNTGYTGPNGQACTACAVGTYKGSSGSAACQSCAAYMTTFYEGKTMDWACACQPGYRERVCVVYWYSIQ